MLYHCFSYLLYMLLTHLLLLIIPSRFCHALLSTISSCRGNVSGLPRQGVGGRFGQDDGLGGYKRGHHGGCHHAREWRMGYFLVCHVAHERTIRKNTPFS